MNFNNLYSRGTSDRSRRLSILRALATATALAATVAAGLSIGAAAEPDRINDEGDAAVARLGLRIAPVPLNLRGKNPSLVGRGSYLVNANGGCNDCHSAGPQSQYAAGGNPFFGQRPAITNPTTYLGGGRDFGSLTPNSPHIVSRNLTPDKSGKPAGNTFAEFVDIIRTGADPDHVHPTCSMAASASCLPAPFDGSLLQIMPWPVYRSMTNQDLFAIYEYLSAIPCLEGGPGEPAHRCN